MSQFNLDARERRREFAAYLKELEDRIANLERSNQLNYASIEGGSLDIYDEEGTLKGSVGVQPDGGVALVPDPENTTPPPTPTAPTVEAALAGLVIGWDGHWDDAEAPPTDFALVQVHVGAVADFTPDASTQIATITDVTGGAVTVHIEGYDPVWVRLVAANTAALTGNPSTGVQGQPRQAVSQDLLDGIISDVKLAQGAVTETKIALEAVTGDKIKPGAVNDLLLADDAVTAAKLATGAVNSTALADGAVLAEKLHDNAVTLGKIAQNAVTELALADEAVTKAKVAAAAIDSTRLADLAVTAQKIGQGAVTAGKIGDQAVTELALADAAVTQAKVAAAAIDTTRLADLAVTAQKIGAAAVTTGKLAAGAVNYNSLTAALADSSSQRYVDAMGDASAWSVLAQAAAGTWQHLTSVPDAPTGKTVGQATGYAVVRGTVQIPYDPDVLYRVSARVRTTAASSSGNDTLHVGVIGVAADGVTLVNRSGANSYSSALYVAASQAPLPAASGWVTFTGYLKGRAATGASAPGSPATDARTPGVVHANTRFISPILYLNYGSGTNGATGTMQVDAVTIEALKTGVVDSTNLVAGSVTTAAIATDAVTATQILAGSITTAKIDANAVTTAKLAANAVTANEIAANTITAGQLAANSVTAASIKAGDVTTAALAAGAVAAGKIAADAVTANEIKAGSVTTAKIDANAVTTAKLAANAVTANEIAAYTITAGQLAVDSVTAASIKAGEVTTAALAAYAVAAGKIAANAVTANEINANAVTAAKIQAGAVTANAIAAGAVTTDKLTVVGGSNVLPDPSFEGAGGAAIAAKQTWLSIDTAFGNGSPSSLKIDATSATAAYRSAELTLLPVTPGDQVYVAADYYPSTNWVGTEIDLQVRWEKADGTILSYSKLSNTTPVKGAWARFTGTVTAPANAVLGRVRAESGNATAGSVWWDNAEVRPVVPGVQIADGAITTPKMVAGSIQGDRIATNSLNADRIVSGSITTSQLNVTTAASVVQKLYDAGADAGRWKVGGTSVSTAAAASNLTSVTVPDSQSGGYVMRAVGGVSSAWRPDILIPYDPNVLYRISGVVRQTVAGSNTANQRFYMGVQGVAADGVTCVSTTGAAATSNAHYVAAAGVNLTAGGGWQRFVGYLKGYAGAGASGTSVASPSPTAPGVLHANARYISPVFFANYQGGTGTAELGMITVEVVETGAVNTVNIADGAITALKILTGAVTTDKLDALAVTSDKIAALAITSDKINALAVTSDKMAANSVTATAIAAGVIDATHIKAGAITADKMLLGDPGSTLLDPDFTQNSSSWNWGSAVRTASSDPSVPAGAPASWVAKIPSQTGANTDLTWKHSGNSTQSMLVSPGETYYLEAWVVASSTCNSSLRLFLTAWDAAGGNVAWPSGLSVAPSSATTWTKVSAQIQIPAGKYLAQFGIGALQTTPTTAAGFWCVTGLKMRRAVDSTLVVGGAITADKLDANAINGKTITGATIQTAASGARVVMDGSLISAYGSGAQKIGLQPDYALITQTGANPTPRIYFTSDDGTNYAWIHASGTGDAANLYTYSGRFTDSADGSTYRWRTRMGQDEWSVERLPDSWMVSDSRRGSPRITVNKTSATIYAPAITARGVFAADNMVCGRVTITPSAANTPTPVTVTGLGLSGSNPRGIATPATTVPGTVVTGVGITDLSTSSVTIWGTRTNTTNINVDYFLIAS